MHADNIHTQCPAHCPGGFRLAMQHAQIIADRHARGLSFTWTELRKPSGAAAAKKQKLKKRKQSQAASAASEKDHARLPSSSSSASAAPPLQVRHLNGQSRRSTKRPKLNASQRKGSKKGRKVKKEQPPATKVTTANDERDRQTTNRRRESLGRIKVSEW